MIFNFDSEIIVPASGSCQEWELFGLGGRRAGLTDQFGGEEGNREFVMAGD